MVRRLSSVIPFIKVYTEKTYIRNSDERYCNTGRDTQNTFTGLVNRIPCSLYPMSDSFKYGSTNDCGRKYCENIQNVKLCKREPSNYGKEF